MLARVYSSTMLGMDVLPIEVEVDVGPGLSKIAIVGLPDEAVKEAKDRVKSAVVNTGYEFPSAGLVINLAPATMKKEGPDFDLALALGILTGSGQIKPVLGEKFLVLGELALDGRIRRTRGILPRIVDARKRQLEGVILPRGNSSEAGIVEGIPLYPVATLREAVEFLEGRLNKEPYTVETEKVFDEEKEFSIDFSDVKGQHAVKRAMEIASAGGHNLLMIGPPGTGKTMLAKRIVTILPRMTFEESIETTMVYSVGGLIKTGQKLITERPFRAPHYTISDIGLVGGGSNPKPGEISLSHNGVLFLDELLEFNRNVLEVLRQPMEDGSVTVSRARGTHTFPARFMLISAMNPCPCGYFTHPKHECRCTPINRQKYFSKVSGPLLDRIDIQIEVPPVPYRKMKEDNDTEDSKAIKMRVEKARQIQKKRFAGSKIFCNSQMSGKTIRKYCTIDAEGENLFSLAMSDFGFSARAHDKILKIARTIADLEDKESIAAGHISEAIQYRTLDRNLAY